ncbi:DUF262 domain-containing protein [Microbacterium sp. CH12i]|uniref:DUF262 domain-containing protein n=1 Tax=Microbacterium sp. CH12i TaxID=1479651 RepID=UPI0009DFDA06
MCDPARSEEHTLPNPNVSAQGWRTLDWLRSAPEISVPVFQRAYRWGADACRTLLNDIRVVANADEHESHFIGSILGTGEAEITLVDGQQRLTSLFLLLIALRDSLGSGDPETVAEIDSLTHTPCRRRCGMVSCLLTEKRAGHSCAPPVRMRSPVSHSGRTNSPGSSAGPCVPARHSRGALVVIAWSTEVRQALTARLKAARIRTCTGRNPSSSWRCSSNRT